MRRNLFIILSLSLLLPLLAACGGDSQSSAKPAAINLDYAYYNPSSLVLHKFGWLEEDLKADGIPVKWVLSAGSNKANEFLRSGDVDFGSTAGSAALLARANGAPIQTVYIFSKPEWAALVVSKDSPIKTVADLKGKKVAATKGTDPYFFLLQSLHEVGLSGSDVEVVNLQHADGKTALERGQVDAWAGLDPHMAKTELESGSRLLYRNIDFNTYGFLNARSEFIEKYPDYVKRVLTAYEKARNWIIANPDQAAQVLADAAQLSLPVAKRELVDRTKFDIDTTPGETQAAVLRKIIPIFVSEQQVKEGTDVEAALKSLFAAQFIQAVAQK